MTLLKLIFITVIIMLPISAFAQTADDQPVYEDQTSPVGLLASYYDAVHRQDYQRAYNYWEIPPDPYNEFVSGFADTLSIQVIIEPPTRIGVAARSQYVEIPIVLIADHRDGTQHTFAGCFITRKSNLQPPAIPEEDIWQLYEADQVEVANATAVATLLTRACATTS